jgi:predicted transcriptional regulator
VPFEFLVKYANGAEYLYANIVENAKRYDKPKELSEFGKPCNFKWECSLCERYDRREHKCYKEIKRPPQSWCYVEELKEIQNG